jgi:hypothetical protein
MQIRELRDLLTHMAWADGLIWASVLGLASADREPRLRQLLHHLHSVQWAYLQIWRDESVQIPDVAGFGDLRPLCAWARAYYRDLASFLKTVPDSE